MSGTACRPSASQHPPSIYPVSEDALGVLRHSDAEPRNFDTATDVELAIYYDWLSVHLIHIPQADPFQDY